MGDEAEAATEDGMSTATCTTCKKSYCVCPVAPPQTPCSECGEINHGAPANVSAARGGSHCLRAQLTAALARAQAAESDAFNARQIAEAQTARADRENGRADLAETRTAALARRYGTALRLCAREGSERVKDIVSVALDSGDYASMHGATGEPIGEPLSVEVAGKIGQRDANAYTAACPRCHARAQVVLTHCATEECYAAGVRMQPVFAEGMR